MAPKLVDRFPALRPANFDGFCFDFESSNLGSLATLELLSYLLTGDTDVRDLPDLYEGAARAVIALGILDPDGSLGPNGRTYLDSLEG